MGYHFGPAPLCAPPGAFSTAYSRRALGEREPEERAAAILPPGPRTGPREGERLARQSERGRSASLVSSRAGICVRRERSAALGTAPLPPEDGRRVLRLCASPARPSSRGTRQARRVRGEGACPRSCALGVWHRPWHTGAHRAHGVRQKCDQGPSGAEALRPRSQWWPMWAHGAPAGPPRTWGVPEGTRGKGTRGPWAC